MTHPCVWQNWFLCVTSPIPKSRPTISMHTPRIGVFCVWNMISHGALDPSIWVPWLINTCDISHSYELTNRLDAKTKNWYVLRVEHDLSIRLTWLIHTCDMCHSNDSTNHLDANAKNWCVLHVERDSFVELQCAAVCRDCHTWSAMWYTLHLCVSLSHSKHPYTTCVSLSLSITTSLPSHLSIFQNALAAPFVRLCRERHREEQRPIENRERVRDRDRSKDRNRGEEGGRERRRRHCDDDHIHIHTHTRTLSLRTCNIACVWVRFYSFEKAKNENSSRPWCTPIYVSLTNTYIQLVLCIHTYK